MTELTPTELIQSRILVLRGQRVIIDADLATLYGVPTTRLNEQVGRNSRKFPEDFVFRLTEEEAQTLTADRSQNATGPRDIAIRDFFPTPSPTTVPSKRPTSLTAMPLPT